MASTFNKAWEEAVAHSARKWLAEEAETLANLKAGNYVEFTEADKAIAWLKGEDKP